MDEFECFEKCVKYCSFKYARVKNWLTLDQLPHPRTQDPLVVVGNRKTGNSIDAVTQQVFYSEQRALSSHVGLLHLLLLGKRDVDKRSD